MVITFLTGPFFQGESNVETPNAMSDAQVEDVDEQTTAADSSPSIPPAICEIQVEPPSAQVSISGGQATISVPRVSSASSRVFWCAVWHGLCSVSLPASRLLLGRRCRCWIRTSRR